MMNNLYDTISQQYSESDAGCKLFSAVDLPTFAKILGDPSGLSVLDLGCGEGRYSRWLKQRGAGRVLGVDISSGMIAIAEKNEAENPLGCRYKVHDAMTLDHRSDGLFDVVAEIWTLAIAKNYEELETLCRVAYQHLTPGGRFLGITLNPNGRSELYNTSFRRYGLAAINVNKKLEEGDQLIWEYVNDPNAFKTVSYHFPVERYEEAFMKTGFVDLKWHDACLSDDANDEQRQYWSEFLKIASDIGFSARKPLSC